MGWIFLTLFIVLSLGTVGAMLLPMQKSLFLFHFAVEILLFFTGSLFGIFIGFYAFGGSDFAITLFLLYLPANLVISYFSVSKYLKRWYLRPIGLNIFFILMSFTFIYENILLDTSKKIIGLAIVTLPMFFSLTGAFLGRSREGSIIRSFAHEKG